MKKMLITGIAGMLGSNIAFLLCDKYDIVGVDINDFKMVGIRFVQQSLIEFDSVRKLLREEKPDVVIHCAAITNVDICETDEKNAQLVNFELTRFLADECALIGAKLVFISSDAVFDGEKEGLYTEQDRPMPVSIYGKTKEKAEITVLKYPDNVVVRTNIYGYNYLDKSSLGEWVINELSKNKILNMFNDVSFSPILVNELVGIIDRCLEKNICGLYHICGTGSISKYDFGCKIKEFFVLPGAINKVSVDTHNFVAKRTKNMGMDNSKIVTELGIKISTPIESIRNFRDLYKKNYLEKLKGEI